MVRKRHPFTSYPAAKHPKRRKLAITDMREKPVEFFWSPAIIVATQVPLQKFLFLLVCNSLIALNKRGDNPKYNRPSAVKKSCSNAPQ